VRESVLEREDIDVYEKRQLASRAIEEGGRGLGERASALALI